jgi:hypothetical protein
MSTITIDRAVLEQAVEALECVCNDERTCDVLGHRRNEYHVIGAECPAVKRLWVAAHKLREALNAPSNIEPLSNVTGQAPKLDAQPEPVIAKGKRLIMVDETFDDLMYWLDRCDEKGHLENCSDLIGPWSNFSYTNAPQPKLDAQP